MPLPLDESYIGSMLDIFFTIKLIKKQSILYFIKYRVYSRRLFRPINL